MVALSVLRFKQAVASRDKEAMKRGNPMPWEKVLNLAPMVAAHLRTDEGSAAVRSFYFCDSDDAFGDKVTAGIYCVQSREIVIRLDMNNRLQYPQHQVRTVFHEFAHALLHYNLAYKLEPWQEVQVELEAELTALTTIWLLGWQQPGDVLDNMLALISGTTPETLGAFLDMVWESRCLPAATQIARRVRAVM